jgi:hypothetical protein
VPCLAHTLKLSGARLWRVRWSVLFGFLTS